MRCSDGLRPPGYGWGGGGGGETKYLGARPVNVRVGGYSCTPSVEGLCLLIATRQRGGKGGGGGV